MKTFFVFFAEKDIEMLRDINSLVEEEVCDAKLTLPWRERR